MRALSLAALLVAAPALAQTQPRPTSADPRADPSRPFGQTADQMRADPTGISASTVSPGDRAADDVVIENPTLDDRSFTALDRDMRALGQNSDAARYTAQRDALRRDYDALGATPTPEARMGVMTRYEDLNASVGMSRMGTASRAEYFRMADASLAGYDRQIAASRRSFDSATGDARAERAAALIRLRSQRNRYRNDVFSVRGAGASGFEDARRTAAPTLSRYDSEFRTGRRAMMAQPGMMDPSMPAGQMQNGQMQNGTMQNGQTQPRPGMEQPRPGMEQPRPGTERPAGTTAPRPMPN